MMWKFVLKRLLAGILTLFCIATLSFFITRMAPGSPFATEGKTSEEARKNREQYYGLDKPLWQQYTSTMWKYMHGNFGPSYDRPNYNVSELIATPLKKSTILGALAFFLAVIVGIPLGVIAAQNQHRLPDHLTMSISIAGICIPNFLLGPLLIMFFSFWLAELPGLDGLPVAGWPENMSLGELQKLIMPVITLGLIHIAYISRLTRSGMLDVLDEDYVRSARSKGLPEWNVVWKHALKNGVSPVISYLGPMAAFVVTGSIVVEKIFAINGLGKYFVDSALSRDYPVLMGAILVFSTLIIVFNLLVDIAYALIDPRVEAK